MRWHRLHTRLRGLRALPTLWREPERGAGCLGVAIDNERWPSDQAGAAQVARVPARGLRGSDSADYFTDGLSTQLIETLQQCSGVAVTSPESSFQFRFSSAPGRTIGKALGATHVLLGNARRNRDDGLVSASLVRVADGSTRSGYGPAHGP